jgi:hypothetical protein
MKKLFYLFTKKRTVGDTDEQLTGFFSSGLLRNL